MQLLHAWTENSESQYIRWQARGVGTTSGCPSTSVANFRPRAKPPLLSGPLPKSHAKQLHLPTDIQNCVK